MIMMSEDIKVFLLVTLCIRTCMHNVLQTRLYHKLYYSLSAVLSVKELSNCIKSRKKWAYLDDDDTIAHALFTSFEKHIVYSRQYRVFFN